MEDTSIAPKISKNPKPYDMDPNIEAMFAYLPLLGIFTSFAIYLMEKNNRFVRFHALQGLYLGIVVLGINIFLYVVFFLSFLSPIINLLAFLVWGYMMWNAYERRAFELPIIGRTAKRKVR